MDFFLILSYRIHVYTPNIVWDFISNQVLFYYFYLFVCFFIHTFCCIHILLKIKYLTHRQQCAASLFWNLWPLLHQVKFFIYIQFFSFRFLFIYYSSSFLLNLTSLCVWSDHIWMNVCDTKRLNIIIIIITT